MIIDRKEFFVTSGEKAKSPRKKTDMLPSIGL